MWALAILAVTLSAPLEPEDVFVSRSLSPTQPFQTFRIPALCRTKKGTLLAFAEGRQSVADQASNVIVLRRREARAKGWSEIHVVLRDEPASLNNPTVLASRSGRVLLMYQRYPAGLSEWSVKPGTDPTKTCRSFVVESADDGKTWSAPRELTEIVRPPQVLSVASGPGIGIELERGPRKGRLVFPFNEGTGGAWTVFAVYSDDGGKTWRRGTSAPKAPGTQPNEVQFAELADGSLLMNARNQASGKFRLGSMSRDGGETWDEAKPIPELPDPVCMGSIMRVSFKPDVLAFSNPDNTKVRENGVLRVSRDGGKTWVSAATITPGSFAYSSLCRLPGGKVAVLYETVEMLAGGGEGYRIRYAEFMLKS